MVDEVSRSNSNPEVLVRLADVIESRKAAAPEASYVARLHHAGVDAIAKKLGEEATETIIAAKNGGREQIVYETADLWFHSLMLLSQFGIRPDEVFAELERRFGTSGLAEKASRGTGA